MKQYLIPFLLVLTFNAVGQENDKVTSTLTKIIAHAEEVSLYRDKVDWETLKPEVYELAKDAKSITELKPAFKYMLKSLGDEHGRIIHDNRILASYSSGVLKDHLKSYNPDIYNQIQMGQVYDFHTEMLTYKIGYIRIVGLPMGDNIKMASEIQTEVCKLKKAGADKWIVDLRYNGGGNMHPMAGGIAVIIGNGIVGGAQGMSTNQNSIWKVENDNFYYDDFSIELDEGCKINNTPKVAVLTSLYTASSGEAIAVIFKGREKTKFFGQKTLGLVTVTDWEVIDDATAMTISVSFYKDRNGVVYDKYVDVDKEMPFVQEPLSDGDTCVKEAIGWLRL